MGNCILFKDVFLLKGVLMILSDKFNISFQNTNSFFSNRMTSKVRNDLKN